MSRDDKFRQIEDLLFSRNLKVAVRDIAQSDPQLVHKIISALNGDDESKFDEAISALEKHNSDIVSSVQDSVDQLADLRSKQPERKPKSRFEHKSTFWTNANEQANAIFNTKNGKGGK
jgi:hypothetical protein